MFVMLFVFILKYIFLVGYRLAGVLCSLVLGMGIEVSSIMVIRCFGWESKEVI